MGTQALYQNPWPEAITRVVVDKIIVFLAPLFLGTMADDIPTARRAACATLASYGAQTDQELRLVALIIAFSFGALDALGRAVGADLSVNQVLRLRGNANALNRAAQQNENRLEKLRRRCVGFSRPTDDLRCAAPVETASAEPLEDLPDSSDTADLVAFARSAMKPTTSVAMAAGEQDASPTATNAPMSRQQRRAVERQAEKLRLRRQEVARRADRTNARMAARVRTPVQPREDVATAVRLMPDAGSLPDVPGWAGQASVTTGLTSALPHQCQDGST
jgi:hypothetical protein